MSEIDVDVISVDQIIEITGENDEEVEAEGDAVVNEAIRNYNELTNKPQIEGTALEGDKTFEELNLNAITNSEIEDLLSLSF